MYPLKSATKYLCSNVGTHSSPWVHSSQYVELVLKITKIIFVSLLKREFLYSCIVADDVISHLFGSIDLSIPYGWFTSTYKRSRSMYSDVVSSSYNILNREERRKWRSRSRVKWSPPGVPPCDTLGKWYRTLPLPPGSWFGVVLIELSRRWVEDLSGRLHLKKETGE